jgi:hypothetical protein
MKDYSGCTLVVAIEPLPAFAVSETDMKPSYPHLARQIGPIQVKAKRVVLLVLADRLIRVHGQHQRRSSAPLKLDASLLE